MPVIPRVLRKSDFRYDYDKNIFCLPLASYMYMVFMCGHRYLQLIEKKFCIFVVHEYLIFCTIIILKSCLFLPTNVSIYLPIYEMHILLCMNEGGYPTNSYFQRINECFCAIHIYKCLCFTR